MTDTLEIRWHGRGGQGTVTAAKVLADACLSGGRYVQAFPEYGPERSGAPLRAYNRVSGRELRMHCPVLHPKVIAVVDATLLDGVNVAEGAMEDTTFIVNTSREPSEMRTKLNLLQRQKVYTVDATKIAIDCFGRALPNSPMLGAVCRVTSIISLEALLEDVRRSFGKKFSQKIIDGNIEAARRGYEEVRSSDAIIQIPAQSITGSFGGDITKAKTMKLKGWRELPPGAVVTEPGSSAAFKTGSWRAFRPEWKQENCIQCMFCWMYCPDMAIKAKDGKREGFDYDYCKGCGICALECPGKKGQKAILMVQEGT